MTESRANRRLLRAEPITLGGRLLQPGTTSRFELPAGLLPNHTEMLIPVIIAHGTRPGPRLWLTGAVHGDELNGVEIIRRVVEKVEVTKLRGTLVCVPIVNVYGFLQHSRELPDGRDLNRSFPGSRRGSLAGRLAHLVMTEIVGKCTHGIDLHTGSNDRTNHPQVRGNLADPETLRIAKAFGAPILMNSETRGGSLRATSSKRGVPVLTYEGGEARRFDADSIRVGVRGVLGVMSEIGMLTGRASGKAKREALRVNGSTWVRAKRGGLARFEVVPGSVVEEGQTLAVVSDPLGVEHVEIRSPLAGVVIGMAQNPVVHGGDALVHVGKLTDR